MRPTTGLFLTLLPLLCCGCLGHLRDRPLSYRDYGGHGFGHTWVDHGTLAGYCGSGAHHAGAQSCSASGCDRCDGNTHVPVGAYQGLPLAHRLKNRLACGDGCGEVYLGEWLSTPPTPDPCDHDGNYTGCGNGMMDHPHAHPVRSTLRKIAGIRFLGTRYADEWLPESPGEWSEPAPTWSNDPITPPLHLTTRAPMAQPSCNCGH